MIVITIDAVVTEENAESTDTESVALLSDLEDDDVNEAPPDLFHVGVKLLPFTVCKLIDHSGCLVSSVGKSTEFPPVCPGFNSQCHPIGWL